MKRRLLEDLLCPLSFEPLQLANGEADGHVENAELVCAGCGRRWQVRRGIPRLVPPDLVEQQRRTAAAFAFEWQHFSEMHPEYEAQFLDWLHPIGSDFFRGKRVLDAGCGTGRHAYYAAQYGASEVVGLDLSEAVETARRVLSEFDNAEVVQGDLLRPPLRTPAEGGGFDLVYSIGVLHHLPDPYEGFRSLCGSCGRVERSPSGCTATRTTASCGMWSSPCGVSRRRCHRRCSAASHGHSVPAFHGVAKGVYDHWTARRSAKGFR